AARRPEPTVQHQDCVLVPGGQCISKLRGKLRQDIRPEWEEENVQAVPVSQGRCHLSSRLVDALPEKRGIQVPIGIGVPVYMAAVILNLAVEILEHNILLAIANDEELNQLLKGGGCPAENEEPNDPLATPREKRKEGRIRREGGKKSKAAKPRTFKKSKSKDSYKEGTSNSTSEDGPADGFTILSFKSLVLGQKISLTQSDISHIGSMKVEGIFHPTPAEIDLKEKISKALEEAGGK
ncbi:hypothetical protein U0070_018995, partial [Myodes glareolus]